MKSLLTILLLCTGLLCHAQPNTTKVTANFSGFHCDGKPGFCSIDNQQNRSLSNSSLTIQSSTLKMTIRRENLSEQEVKNLFNLQASSLDESKLHHLILPNRFVLPAAVCSSLGSSNTTLIIAKGTYPIQITKDSFIINFNLE